ncbi:MAG: hypothetical protein Q9199_007745, partial [Rusavskia elegans]
MASQNFLANSEHHGSEWMRVRSSKWFLALTVGTSLFNDGLVYGMLVPVLPFSLVERSGVSPDKTQFWVSAMLVIHGLFMLLSANVAGWLAERRSWRKPTFLVGLALQFAGTIMFALGSHPYLLATARSLQGASSGVVFTAGLSLLVAGIDRDELGWWIGIVFTGLTAGLTFAPLLGGLIYASAGYSAVFAAALVAITVAFLLGLLCADPQRRQQLKKGDSAQRDYDTFSHGQPRGQVSSDTLSSDTSPDNRMQGCDHEESFLINKPSRERLTGPLDKERSFLMRYFPTSTILLRSPRVLAAIYGTLLQVSLLTSFDGVLPLFVHRTFNWDSSASGAIFIALALPSVFGGVAGTLSDRFGARVVALVGFIFSSIMIAPMCLVNHNSVQQVVLLCALLVLTGCGTALMLSPLAADISLAAEQLEKEHKGIFGPDGPDSQAYALFNSAHAAGTVIGPAFAGAIYDKAGWSVAIWALAGLCASGIPM